METLLETPPFVAFPKIARLNRDIVVTEKLDGTNACVHVTEDGQIVAGSRTRWLTVEKDNFGFARWVAENKDELLKLGVGTHFGEWFGSGIQRGYGLKEKRFYLFNTNRWNDDAVRPVCCGVVPTLYFGSFSAFNQDSYLDQLRNEGSVAVPGFMKPEGTGCFPHRVKHALQGDV